MTLYRERLSVPWDWWLRGAIAVAVVWWVFAVSTNLTIATSMALLTLAAILGGLRTYGAIDVVVSQDWLNAGRASIERTYCAKARVISEDDFRWQTGPGADARAFMVTRPYVTQGVLIEIDDPNDPTPYWLLSSRHPERLAAALQTE